MGHNRQEVDLELRLKTPAQARAWIADYRRKRRDCPRYTVLDYYHATRRVVYFDTMSDAEAVEAALHMLKNWVAFDAMEEKNYSNLDPH